MKPHVFFLNQLWIIWRLKSSTVHRKAFTPPPLEKWNRLLYCASKNLHKMAKHNKTCPIRRQNSCHKASKVCTARSNFFPAKHCKTSTKRRQNSRHKAAKVCTVRSNFFSCTPRNVYSTPKKYHFYFKK